MPRLRQCIDDNSSATNVGLGCFTVTFPPKVGAGRFYCLGFLRKSLFVVDVTDALALVLEATELPPAAIFALID